MIEEINEDGKKTFWFLASDIAHIMDITNIRPSIINYDEDERCIRKTSTPGGNQDALFLSTHGVYRFLYNCRKPIAKQFRKWVGNILDDIIMNEGKILKEKLNESQVLIEANQRVYSIANDYRWCESYKNKMVVYFGLVEGNLPAITNEHDLQNIQSGVVKFGSSDSFGERIESHKRVYGQFHVLWVIECTQNRRLESLIKKHALLNKSRITKNINGIIHNELLRLSNCLSFATIKKIVMQLQKELSETIEILEKQIELTNAQIRLAQITHPQFTTLVTENINNTIEPIVKIDVGTQTQTQSVPIHKNQEIPNIPEPDSITETYYYWDTVLRPYFSVVTRPNWRKKTDGSGAMKRYYTIEAFGLFIDYVISQSEKSCDDVLQDFINICTKYHAKERNFIKYCVYNYILWCTKGRVREAHISPQTMKEELDAYNFPPAKSIKQMRKMWHNNEL